VTGKTKSEGGSGTKLHCTCKGDRHYSAFCIHKLVTIYCARRDCLPRGYFESPEGEKYLKLSKNFGRVDLEETVKEVRRLMKEKKQGKAIKKIEAVKRNVEAHKAPVAADQSAAYLLDKVVDMVKNEKKRLAGKIRQGDEEFRLFASTSGYQLVGKEDVVQVDVLNNQIRVWKIVGPRQWDRQALYQMRNMAGFLVEDGRNLALSLLDLI
jgi:hypothetical protein